MSVKKYFSGLKSFISTIHTSSNYMAGVNYYVGGTRNITETHTVAGQMAAYNFCPAVSGIVNRKTKAFMNGYWAFVDENGEESKASEIVELRKLLKNPNPIQSWKTFIAQAKSYEQIFGECFIYALRPDGMQGFVSQLWVIPNWIGQPGYKDDTYIHPPLFEGYENFVIKDEKGFEYELPLDDILIIRDIGTNSTNPIKGQSRLISLQDPVSNIIAAYEARNVLMTRRGAIGILSNDSKDSMGNIPMDNNERENLQKDFSNYGISKDKFQAIITNANLKWQQMTFPTKDLLLFEEVEDDTRQIADNYDYPIYLLGFKNGSTFNNVNEAKKSLYQDAIIPESELWADSFTKFFNLENVMFEITYEHVDVFKKGEKEKAEMNKAINDAMQIAYTNKVVTLEEWRLALGYDPDIFTGETFHQQSEPEPDEVVTSEMIKIREMEKQIKELSCKIADIDGKKRMVKAYYSAFGNVDSDGDVIEPGAGRKTIKENGPGGKDIIRHFLNHSFKANPEVLTIGKIKEIGEDSHGNYFWSKIARTALGEDIYKMYEDDMINNHSFGFIPIKQKVINGINHIFEYKMFEVSTVTTWSANERTPTIEVKEGEPERSTRQSNKALFVEPSRYTLDQKAAMQTIFKLTKFNF